MRRRAIPMMLVVPALGLVMSLAACSRGSRVDEHGSARSDASASPSGQIFGGNLSGGAITDADWDAAVAGAKANTALVRNSGCGFTATGSAAAIGPRQLVTNKHVVEGARKMSVVTTAGARAQVTSWTYSRSDDLALLELAEPLFPDPLAVASGVVPGDLVVVMGFPLGGPFTTGRGRISGLADDFDEPMLEASVDILPGNSGGPLVNTKGQIAGLVRAIDLQGDQALAIPPERVDRAIDGIDMAQGVPCR